MKKYKFPTDEFLREIIKDHQVAPSETARKAFLKDAIGILPAQKKRKTGFILLAALIILVCTGIIIWNFTSKNPQSPVAEKTIYDSLLSAIPPSDVHLNSTQPSKRQTIPKEQSQKNEHPQQTINISQAHLPIKQLTLKKSSVSKPLTVNIAAQKTNPSQSASTAPEGRSSAPPAALPVSPASSSSSSFTAPAADSPVAIATMATQLYSKEAESSTDPRNAKVQNPLNQVPAGDSMLAKTPDTTTIRTTSMTTSERSEPSGESPVRRSKWIPSIGVYYTPEWMFNTLEGTKFVNNFGLEGSFHFGKFSLRTGAGISIGKGTNELVVEYNDFLGVYNKLDSMNFTWNDPTHTYIPTMYMSKQDVWDSLMKLDYARVVKRYTYLQIPMIMGYDIWETGSVSLGLRVGPVMSILIATKQLSSEYEAGKKRIVSINDIAPEQITLNWQVMGGFNVAFRLTETLSIEAEPCVRYYFNSVYEKPANNTKPWSAGLRAALFVKF